MKTWKSEAASWAMVLSCVTGLPSLAQSQDVFESAAFVDRVREMVVAQRVPGAALVVVEHGELATVGTFGIAGADGREVTVDSVFPVGAVSLVFTGVAAARLAVQDRLELDADVREGRGWLRQYAPGSRPVTMRQLLTHAAGFDDRMIGVLSTEAAAIRPLDEYLERNMPQRSTDPDTQARFSSHGGALAGLVVEQVHGADFAQAVRDLVFDPLEMRSSTFERPLPTALAQRQVRAMPCPTTRCDPRTRVIWRPGPAGNMVTTAADMSKFLLAMVAQRSALGADATDLVSTRAWGSSDDLPGFSLAMHEQNIAGARGLVHSGGDIGGYRSLLAWVPELRAGLFFVTSGGTEAIGSMVLAAFGDQVGGSVARSPAEQLTPEQVDEYPGVYLLTRSPRESFESYPGRFIYADRVAADRDGYLFRVEGSIVQRYGRVGPDRFRAVDSDAVLVFERDAGGAIDAMHATDVSFGARFPATFERLSTLGNPQFIYQTVPLVVAAPLVLLLFWLFMEGARGTQKRAATAARAAPRRTALNWFGIAFALVTLSVDLTYVFGFMVEIQNVVLFAPQTLALGLPDQLARWFWLPWGVGLSTVLLVFATGLAWLRPAQVWLFDRVLLAVVCVSAVSFAFVLVHFRMLPPAG